MVTTTCRWWQPHRWRKCKLRARLREQATPQLAMWKLIKRVGSNTKNLLRRGLPKPRRSRRMAILQRTRRSARAASTSLEEDSATSGRKEGSAVVGEVDEVDEVQGRVAMAAAAAAAVQEEVGEAPLVESEVDAGEKAEAEAAAAVEEEQAALQAAAVAAAAEAAATGSAPWLPVFDWVNSSLALLLEAGMAEDDDGELKPTTKVDGMMVAVDVSGQQAAEEIGQKVLTFGSILRGSKGNADSLQWTVETKGPCFPIYVLMSDPVNPGGPSKLHKVMMPDVSAAEATAEETAAEAAAETAADAELAELPWRRTLFFLNEVAVEETPGEVEVEVEVEGVEAQAAPQRPPPPPPLPTPPPASPPPLHTTRADLKDVVGTAPANAEPPPPPTPPASPPPTPHAEAPLRLLSHLLQLERRLLVRNLGPLEQRAPTVLLAPTTVGASPQTPLPPPQPQQQQQPAQLPAWLLASPCLLLLLRFWPLFLLLSAVLPLGLSELLSRAAARRAARRAARAHLASAASSSCAATAASLSSTSSSAPVAAAPAVTTATASSSSCSACVASSRRSDSPRHAALVASAAAVRPAPAAEAEADAEAKAAPVQAFVGPGSAPEELLQRPVLSYAELAPPPPPPLPRDAPRDAVEIEEEETWVVAYERALALLEEAT